MGAVATVLRPPVQGAEPVDTTLLELVTAVSEVTEDDREVVATVLEMLRTRRVRLCGNFRGEPVSRFLR